MAHAGVDGAEFGGELFQFIRNRWEDCLHGFNQIKIIIGAQAVDSAVDILGVGAIFRQAHANLLGFDAEAIDGIDLAVMAKDSKGL